MFSHLARAYSLLMEPRKLYGAGRQAGASGVYHDSGDMALAASVYRVVSTVGDLLSTARRGSGAGH